MLAPQAPAPQATRPNFAALAMSARGVVGHPLDAPEVIARAREVRDEAETWAVAATPRRRERKASRDLLRGGSHHWNRTVKGDDGRTVTEAEWMESRGRRPVVMNLTASHVMNVVGQFRQNASEREIIVEDEGPLAGQVGEDGRPLSEHAARMLSAGRRAMRREAASDELEADAFMEHAVSGLSAFRSSLRRGTDGPMLGRATVFDEQVHPDRLIYNLDVTDRRMSGLRIVGEVVDLAPGDLVRVMGYTQEEAARALAFYSLTLDDLAPGARRASRGTQGYGFSRYDQMLGSPLDRVLIQPEGTLRVLDVWTLEPEWRTPAYDPLAFEPTMAHMAVVPQGSGALPPAMEDPQMLAGVNAARQELGLPPVEVGPREMGQVWTRWVLTPRGDVLMKRPTPYWHGEHPYTVIPALHVDGETWGVVSNIADPQRWLNATLSTLDFAMRTNGRGTTYADLDALDNSGLDIATFEKLRVRGDATIGIRKGTQDWDQVLQHDPGGNLPAGAFEMMSALPAMMERITGVSAAAMGVTPQRATTATQHAREVVQSSTNVYVYADSYFDGLSRKDRKETRLLQQCMERPFAFRENKTGERVDYDPAVARAVRVSVAMGRAANTPERREVEEAMRREDMSLQAIPPEIYYQHSTRADAPGILRDLREYQAQQLQLQLALAEAAPQEDTNTPE